MRRRLLLKLAALTPVLTCALHAREASGQKTHKGSRARARPGNPDWPSAEQWAQLNRAVGGRLIQPVSPFAGCGAGQTDCSAALTGIKNPYWIGDQPALTQASGWVDAWTCMPSAYAVAAEGSADVVAAVNFARNHNLRLVVRGGGHGYQGASNAPDSLLIWTRRMNSATVHDDFVARGCSGKQSPQPAVTVGAGALWADAYEMVTTRAGRYVQGGGCRTVGVAGLVQGGGFGSWSKGFGTAAGGLIEAELITTDGVVRVVNECQYPDLFWAIKGGGGGTFGVVTRFTLRTHDLPEYLGAVATSIRADSDGAYRALIAEAMSFYAKNLFNAHWGEKFVFGRQNTLGINMLCQDLSPSQVENIWAPFFAWVRARKEYSFGGELQVLVVPAQRFWDPAYMNAHLPGVALMDDRAGAPPYHAFWRDNRDESGQSLYAYQSAWLPATLLEPSRQPALVDAIFASSRQWGSEFHFNKGLAGASAKGIAAVRDTSTNPQVLDAFALAIIGANGPPDYPGMPGPGIDVARARNARAQVAKAMGELLKVAPSAGAYVNESDYFQADWQRAFWGTSYPKLLAIKRRYDPEGLFFVHHGVGSEDWSADGFTRLDSTSNPNSAQRADQPASKHS
jgi:FAD/FMN-containing dehydrogenase